MPLKRRRRSRKALVKSRRKPRKSKRTKRKTKRTKRTKSRRRTKRRRRRKQRGGLTELEEAEVKQQTDEMIDNINKMKEDILNKQTTNRDKLKKRLANRAKIVKPTVTKEDTSEKVLACTRIVADEIKKQNEIKTKTDDRIRNSQNQSEIFKFKRYDNDITLDEEATMAGTSGKWFVITKDNAKNMADEVKTMTAAVAKEMTMANIEIDKLQMGHFAFEDISGCASFIVQLAKQSPSLSPKIKGISFRDSFIGDKNGLPVIKDSKVSLNLEAAKGEEALETFKSSLPLLEKDSKEELKKALADEKILDGESFRLSEFGGEGWSVLNITIANNDDGVKISIYDMLFT
jgi:hypothetical protein